MESRGTKGEKEVCNLHTLEQGREQIALAFEWCSDKGLRVYIQPWERDGEREWVNKGIYHLFVSSGHLFAVLSLDVIHCGVFFPPSTLLFLFLDMV